VRQRLCASAAAPMGESRCVLAVGTDRSTAASERGAEGDVVATRAVGAVVEVNELVSGMAIRLKPATELELENDNRTFAFAQPARAQREERAEDQSEAERPEFLLAIGYGLPRGP